MRKTQKQLAHDQKPEDSAGSLDALRKDRTHSHAPKSPIATLGHSEATEGAHSASRREFLSTLQQTHGNAFVQKFIGEEIIAARGHNSPPATGPGSIGDPLVGAGATQTVSGMSAHAYYKSPVNPTNPVVVWTDGTNLFFAPSQAQITAGRAVAMPEPKLILQPGYSAEEIRWDRREMLTTGGGPLLILARRAGQPDILIAISNTLNQKSYYDPGTAGSADTGLLHVSREGAEFLQADDTTVPLELSGATARGGIHAATFADGFFRYRAPGGNHDLYISRGTAPVAHLVGRATGNITQTFAFGTIDAIVPESNGVVHLEQTTTSSASTTPTTTTTTIDLRVSPPTVTSATGHASAEAGYATAKADLVALGVTIEERGVRFRVLELEGIRNALTTGSNRGLDALLAFRTLEGLSASDPILSVTKMIGPDDARGDATVGGGTPTLTAKEPFEASATDRTSTIRHEMTHVVMGAIDAVTRSGLTTREKANLEGAMRFAARTALKKARAGELRASEYGAGDPVPSAGAVSDWRGSVGHDVDLASIWIELLRRYRFIPDPEGTRELRGTALVDESRYSRAGDVAVGHPENSIGEFVASFVASATLFQTQFVAAVLDAETAAKALGGSGGTYLRRLYRKAWKIIDSKYVPLGPNPF